MNLKIIKHESCQLDLKSYFFRFFLSEIPVRVNLYRKKYYKEEQVKVAKSKGFTTLEKQIKMS